jgi:hypothetical protein
LVFPGQRATDDFWFSWRHRCLAANVDEWQPIQRLPTTWSQLYSVIKTFFPFLFVRHSCNKSLNTNQKTKGYFSGGFFFFRWSVIIIADLDIYRFLFHLPSVHVSTVYYMYSSHLFTCISCIYCRELLFLCIFDGEERRGERNTLVNIILYVCKART